MQSHIAKQILSVAEHIKEHGYGVIKNFLTPEQCQKGID